jgi:FkbM family methyltransferase
MISGNLREAIESKLPSVIEDVEAACGLWADETMREQWVNYLDWRFSPDEILNTTMPVVETRWKQYHMPVFRLTALDLYIDCGAYDGDTVREMAEEYGDKMPSMMCLEPDPSHYESLVNTVCELPEAQRVKVEGRQVAVADYPSFRRFSQGWVPMAAKFDLCGPIVVRADALDVILKDRTCICIKMDIEGAEIEALLGAENVIKRDQPIMLMEISHVLDHVWRIPLMLRKWLPAHEFFLCQHNVRGDDLILYAVPPHRVLAL